MEPQVCNYSMCKACGLVLLGGHSCELEGNGGIPRLSKKSSQHLGGMILPEGSGSVMGPHSKSSLPKLINRAHPAAPDSVRSLAVMAALGDGNGLSWIRYLFTSLRKRNEDLDYL